MAALVKHPPIEMYQVICNKIMLIGGLVSARCYSVSIRSDRS